MADRSPLHCIVPPDLLLRIAAEGDAEERQAALGAVRLDAGFRIGRAEIAARRAAVVAPSPRTATGVPHRSIYDQHHAEDLHLGTLVRSEGGEPSGDVAVDQAFDGLGATHRLYWEVFGRDSIDGQGEPLLGLVHFGHLYDNAFWDGDGHMVFGDGDGKLFTGFTASLDVIGHELTHGVTQHEANLTYSGQPGALNESVSDVFGSLVKQHTLKQSAAEADWLIGAEVVGPSLAPALRSLKAPGTANRYDRQPADMDGYVHSAEDNGGVHTNSGIPNHAFYVTTTAIGGNAWEHAGAIWYAALRDPHVRPSCTFRTFAEATLRQARDAYGRQSAEADAVRAGWDAVKVPVPAPTSRSQ